MEILVANLCKSITLLQTLILNQKVVAIVCLATPLDDELLPDIGYYDQWIGHVLSEYGSQALGLQQYVKSSSKNASKTSN